MALSTKEDTTQFASPRKKNIVPVVELFRYPIDVDSHSVLIVETPPPHVVNSGNESFEQFTSTSEIKSDASVYQPSSDSDSGGSLFITQSVKAVQTERQHKSEFISDCGDERDNGDAEKERENGCQRAVRPNGRRFSMHIAPRRAILPFLLKSGQHLAPKKHQILENSEMGGFLKCIKKIEEGYVNKERAISPSVLESELSDNSEKDDYNSDHEVTKVDRTIFVPSYFKGNKHKWLPQSLEMRIKDSLSNDNEQQLININGKDKKSKTKSTKKSKTKSTMKSKTKSTKKNKTSASVKKQSKKKHEAVKSKALVRTSSESSIDSLFKEQEKQHETQEVLAACSDAEHSDPAHCRQRLTKQIVQCAENLHGDHLVMIEETQRNSIELITEAVVHIEHEDNMRSPSQADDIIGLENAVSDLQSTRNQKMKKKHKLKEQEEAEPGADTRSADNVNSVEMDQFSDSQSTDMTPKERTKTANVEDNSGTDILSNETFEAPVTEQPEHIQTSEEITGCPSPNVARLKSGKKKKKKNGCEESQYESDDFPLDVSSVSQFDNVTDRSTTQETVEERPSDVVKHTEAELNDAERSDSVQCAENLDGDHLELSEEKQRKTVEAVTEPAVEHEKGMRPNNYLPNKCNSMLPSQGGDISIQNDIQQTDSDFGSEDLFRPLNSQKHKTNQIHKAASIIANTEESDQDSDVTQIETEGPFESIYGQGTPRWCDGDTHAHADDDSDETQIETEGQYVSVFGPGTPNKQITTQDMNGTKHPESQKKDQSPVGQNAELLSRTKEKDESNNIKRKTMSRSHKDSEDTGVVETVVNVQCASSKHLPLADEPLREVYSSPCVRHILGKRRARAEMETDLPESPLFRNGGLTFIKRKVKRNDKMSARDLIKCDTNADVSSETPVDDISGDKTTLRENEKSCEVENRVTSEEQREASVLHLEETSELLEESILSVEADNSVTTKVKRKKKKRYKLNEHEDGVDNQSVETVQFSKSQSTEQISKVTKKKKRKDKEKTKMAYMEENSATDNPSSETLHSDRPAELRVNEVNQTSEAPETDLPETSEEITGCPMPNVTTLKSVKKKKKRDETEEPEYESVDLDVSSVSQFDHVAEIGVVGQQDDQFFEERPNDKNTAETLEGNTPHILKVAKRKKKSQNVSSPSQSDDIIGLEIQVSGSQSGSAEELLEKKKKKEQKLKERKNVALASDIGNNVQLFQQSESQTTDLLSRKTKKKRANKDKERTTGSSSNKLSEHMDDGHSEMRGNVIQSTEATVNDQLEHLQTSEEITRCPSSNVTKLSSGKKKKKKRDKSEKHQDESVDVDLDVSYMIERMPNTAEHVENMNSPVLSDSTFTSKPKKKKKHKLKEQEKANIHSADNVHSVEMDQFSESQTTEMTPKRTKKKRKDKERTKTAHDSGTDILSNETFEGPVTEQPEHIQTSEEITGCPSPNITKLKSGKKKKKKNSSKESQYESVDFALDASSVSQETFEEKPNDVEHTEAELNDTKHKKKRKRSSLSINNSSEFSSSDAQMQETVTPERKRKKKRNSDHITNGELTSKSSDHTVPQAQSPLTKKSKRKQSKEMNESTSQLLDDSAELETVQTKRTDSTHANVIISLGDYEDISKKKKKRKTDTENNIAEISMSQNTDSPTLGNGDNKPKKPEKQKQRCHDRAGSVQTYCNANIFVQSHRKPDAYKENNLKEESGAREPSLSQTGDVMLRKNKKKRKRRDQSVSVLDS